MVVISITRFSREALEECVRSKLVVGRDARDVEETVLGEGGRAVLRAYKGWRGLRGDSASDNKNTVVVRRRRKKKKKEKEEKRKTWKRRARK